MLIGNKERENSLIQCLSKHRCNDARCRGFFLIKNVDLDFKNTPTDERRGVYAFEQCTYSNAERDF